MFWQLIIIFWKSKFAEIDFTVFQFSAWGTSIVKVFIAYAIMASVESWINFSKVKIRAVLRFREKFDSTIEKKISKTLLVCCLAL